MDVIHETPPNWSAVAPQAINVGELDALVKAMQEKWAEFEVQKKAADALREQYDEIKSKVLATLKAAGKSKWQVDGLGTAYIINKFQVPTPKTIEQKKVFFDFLREKGEDVFMSFATVNSQTLNSFYNQEMKAAQERGDSGFTVPGLDEPTHRETLGFRKDR